MDILPQALLLEALDDGGRRFGGAHCFGQPFCFAGCGDLETLPA